MVSQDLFKVHSLFLKSESYSDGYVYPCSYLYLWKFSSSQTNVVHSPSPHTHTPLFCYTHNPYIYFYIILIASFPIIVNSSSVFSLQSLLYFSLILYTLHYIQLIHMANSTVELSLHIVMKICRESYLGFLDISRLLLVKGKVHSVKRQIDQQFLIN